MSTKRRETLYFKRKQEHRCKTKNDIIRQIILGHLSENNNTPELAFQTIVESLSREGIVEGKDVLVDVATQSHLTRIF